MVVTGVHSGAYADPLGENKWPIETCRFVTQNLDGFAKAARIVGHSRDGAIVISTDGTIQEQMIRIKSPGDGDNETTNQTIEYADCMGTKHLSAIEVSIRQEVVAALTPSEEDGQMKVIMHGPYYDY